MIIELARCPGERSAAGAWSVSRDGGILISWGLVRVSPSFLNLFFLNLHLFVVIYSWLHVSRIDLTVRE